MGSTPMLTHGDTFSMDSPRKEADESFVLLLIGSSPSAVK